MLFSRKRPAQGAAKLPTGVPESNRKIGFGESGGNRALYVAQRHLIAQFAERDGPFVYRLGREIFIL